MRMVAYDGDIFSPLVREPRKTGRLTSNEIPMVRTQSAEDCARQLPDREMQIFCIAGQDLHGEGVVGKMMKL